MRRLLIGLMIALGLAVTLSATVLDPYTTATFDGGANACGGVLTYTIQAFDSSTNAMVYSHFYSPSDHTHITVSGANVTYSLVDVKSAVGSEDVYLHSVALGRCGRNESTVAIFD